MTISEKSRVFKIVLKHDKKHIKNHHLFIACENDDDFSTILDEAEKHGYISGTMDLWRKLGYLFGKLECRLEYKRVKLLKAKERREEKKDVQDTTLLYIKTDHNNITACAN